MAATADDKGLKRICMSCGARFYDLNRTPIVCPACQTEFTGEIKVKARRGRVSPADAPEEEDQTAETEVVEEEIEEEGDTVSLEEVEDDDDLDEDEEDLGLDDDDLDDLDDDLDDLDEDEEIEEVEDDK